MTRSGRETTAALTGLALIAFAANSVLCRLALGGGSIDAASFTSVRLISGAVTLFLIALILKKRAVWRQGRWISAAMLFVYAVAFSFAYLSLSAGTGALILFGAVQATMILAGLMSGERPGAREWGGVAVAVAGVVYLVSPGLTAPSPVGSALMALAGIGWGAYSLLGRGTKSPLADTTSNFLRTVPAAICVSLASIGHVHLSTNGVLLACASGAVASGVGYAIWYSALRGLTATRAATVQLSVPVIAALGGVIFLFEAITTRLVVSAVLILGGVGVAVTAR
ncbi:MAG: DMT family transporter [Planctomycetota bacterium]|nr:DMT family transporter [Planctomycetota bacterium]